MNGYVLRKGDLIATNQGAGIITKTTKGYIYYFYKILISTLKTKQLLRFVRLTF